MIRVMTWLTLVLLFALMLPQAWTRSVAHAANKFAFDHVNHTLLLHITELGDGVFCGSIGLMVVAFRPDLFKRVLLLVIVAMLLSNGLKSYFNYPRPPAVYGIETVIGPAHTTRSFPSGHTLTAFIVAGFLWQIFRRLWIRIVTLILAGLVALSRVLLGVHWLTDVCFGAWLGWGTVMILCVVFPTKFDIDETPVWLQRWRQRPWFNSGYRWFSQPFSRRGNQVAILLCGVLTLLTIIQKPSITPTIESLRQLIGVIWIGVILTQLYYLLFARNDTH